MSYAIKMVVSKELVKVSNDFNGKKKCWIKFKKVFITYMGNTINTYNILLIYVFKVMMRMMQQIL